MADEERLSEPGATEHVVEAEAPSRRRFLSLLAGTLVTITGAAVVGPLAGMFLAPLLQRRKELWLTIGRLDDVAPDQPKKFVYRYVRTDGWYEKTIYGTAYAIRNGSETTVLTNVCTHLGCGVRWDVKKKEFLCPCHNGVFDRSGNVVSGPPPKPLKRFVSRVARGDIQIKVEEA